MKVKNAERKNEISEGIGLALELLEGAKRDILRAKYILRAVGANEHLTLYQVQGLIRDMDEYVLSILRDWKKAEDGANAE